MGASSASEIAPIPLGDVGIRVAEELDQRATRLGAAKALAAVVDFLGEAPVAAVATAVEVVVTALSTPSAAALGG